MTDHAEPSAAEQVRTLREAIDKHFTAAAAWTKEFQPGGLFAGVLPPGSNAAIDGGLWLVNEVQRLREKCGEHQVIHYG